MTAFKKMLLGLTVIALLAGCNTTPPPVLQPAKPTAEESENLPDLGYTYLWDVAPPAGANYFSYWLEYYRDGDRIDTDSQGGFFTGGEHHRAGQRSRYVGVV